jgi:hypothetical protein
MATYDRNLGVWRAKDGSIFPDQSSAEDYEGSGIRAEPGSDTGAFGAEGDAFTPYGGGVAPERSIEEQEKDAAARAFREQEEALRNVPYGSAQSPTAGTAQATQSSIGSTAFASGGSAPAPRKYVSVTQTAPGSGQAGGTSRPGGTGSGNEDLALENQQDSEAQREFQGGKLSQQFNDAAFGISDAADESRGMQRGALAKQQQLYDLLTSFDPDAYAEQFSDLALKNQLAIARSSTGGAASGQAGMFEALRQAPGIQAEAQRGAQAVQDRRLGQAAEVTSQMGQLATAQRGQDITQDQLKSEFGVRIAQGIADFTGLQWELDSRDSALLAEIALALDSQDIQWAALSLEEQIAEANRVLAERGLDQQWKMFKEGQKLTEKDIFGGLVSILGEGISGGFKIAAAGAA